MNICLIGSGVTNLILAKILADKRINVSLLLDSKKTYKLNSRTIGISKNNFDFINYKVTNIKKICWPINFINIYNEINQQEELLNFGQSEKELFLVVKNIELQKLLLKIVKKNKFIKIKKIKNKKLANSILKKRNFDLIINSDTHNDISKKFFFKKIKKDYNSSAFTSIISHESCNNNTAIQIFTKFGPLAFLPCSKVQTSVVFSIYNEKIKKNDKIIKDLIKKYNRTYKINSFSEFEKFDLKFSIPREYYYKNILSFGDGLHKIHPLAGQGLNMVLRDIKTLSDLIDKRIDLGLPLDSEILKKFELKSQHLNYIFSSGINFIYYFFKLDNKINNNYSKKILNYLGKNKYFKKYTTEFADKGILF